MIELLRSLPNAVPDMLRHVECPMIMDLLLKVIALDRNDGGQGVVEVCTLRPQLLTRSVLISSSAVALLERHYSHPAVMPRPREQLGRPDRRW